MGNVASCECPPRNTRDHEKTDSELDVARDLAARLGLVTLSNSASSATLMGKDISAKEQRLFMRVMDKLEEHTEFMSSGDSSMAGDSVINGGMDTDYGDDTELQRWQTPSLFSRLLAGLLGRPPSLPNVRVEDWELVSAWEQLRHHQLPDRLLAERILKAVTKLYASQPNVVKVARPGSGQNLIVVGDLHGHLGDLMHILDEYGEPKEGAGGTAYVFNGDYVDRGTWGPEVLLCLYCLKLRFPGAVHLNRGNHEDVSLNLQPENGFRDVHCVRAWKKDAALMYRLCRRSFLCLPLVHVIGDELCVLHGGLALDPGVTLAEINMINRKRDLPMRSCQNLGYPAKQKVTARRELITREKDHIAVGTPGQIIGKIKKSRAVEVAFADGHAVVEVFGAPELEQNLSIEYADAREKELQRLDRIFLALLWSDPIEENPDKDPEEPGPNTARGMGMRFDAKVTEEFLQNNGLQCLLRSHQKRETGYETEFRRGDAPLAVTIFSASNYPAGAGELLQAGNKASVAVLSGEGSSVSQPLTSVMKASKPWSEPHSDLVRWSRPVIGGKALTGIKASEPPGPTGTPPTPQSSGTQDKKLHAKLARDQALEQLWLKIYCRRPELMAFLSNLDRADTGAVTLAQWASAMRGCLIPDESFPWEELAPHLATFYKGKCQYMAFLMRYKNVLSARLESHWTRRALGQLFGKMGGGDDAEAQWKQLDRNADGQLSYFELRPLLKANLEFTASDIENDGVYALLAAMDKNCSGFVEKGEFLDAIGRGREWHENPERLGQASKEENEAIDRCWGFLHSAMRTLASKRTSVSKLFNFLDTSRDGVLSSQEFMTGMKILLKEDKQLTKNMSNWHPLLWTLIDTDSSGSELQSALYVVDSVSE